jgi:hypothetical protein
MVKEGGHVHRKWLKMIYSYVHGRQLGMIFCSWQIAREDDFVHGRERIVLFIAES